MERQFHDALSDTLYTADVCRMLDLRAGLAAYPTEEESLRASLCPTPGDYRDLRSSAATWSSTPGAPTPKLHHELPGVRRTAQAR